LRKEKKRKRIRSDVCLEEQKIVDSSENIEKDFITSEKVKWLYDCIDRLSLLEKTLISLYLEDLSYREIADVVGITEQNVGVKIFRIKKTLNSYLKEY
jgi:RNA polymerase sigma-70 factor (ECF subfamily)